MTPVPEFYLRPALNVETYDVRAQGDLAGTMLEGDVGFYLELAERTGGPVLELGCGTGRVTWPLGEIGLEAVGLDLSPSMLAEAEARRADHPAASSARVTFVEGDMTEFDLGRSFRLVIIPARAFMMLLDPEAQRSCLACVRRHLDADGRLVVDLFDPRLDWCVPDFDGARDEDTVAHPATGRPVTVEVRERVNDPFRQQLRELWRFRELGDDGMPVREEQEALTLRWTYRQEMRYLLELTGFEVEAEWGGFKGQAPGYATEQVWVARPREPAR